MKNPFDYHPEQCGLETSYLHWMLDPHCIHTQKVYIKEVAELIQAGKVGPFVRDMYIAASEVLREDA